MEMVDVMHRFKRQACSSYTQSTSTLEGVVESFAVLQARPDYFLRARFYLVNSIKN